MTMPKALRPPAEVEVVVTYVLLETVVVYTSTTGVDDECVQRSVSYHGHEVCVWHW